MANDIKDLMEFFQKDTREFEKGEFLRFWKELSEEEKAYYKNADLS